MQYFTEFLLILMFSFFGEFIHHFVPLPVPASIYGMVFMFLALRTGIVKLSQVEDTGKLLIEIMPLMFVPAGVGLMTSFDVLRPMLIPFAVITVVTNITVMLASGHISQFFIRKGGSKNE